MLEQGKCSIKALFSQHMYSASFLLLSSQIYRNLKIYPVQVGEEEAKGPQKNVSEKPDSNRRPVGKQIDSFNYSRMRYQLRHSRMGHESKIHCFNI